MLGKESTALRNTAAYTDTKYLHRNEPSALPPEKPLSYHNQESLFVLNWKTNFTKKESQKLYLENKQNIELTLPSALIVTSDILKVTFGFAVPIKTDVSSQAPIVCFQEGRLELWIIVVLFIQNWKRQTAECSLIK